ncbi:MAG: aldo/keto reductase [Clostridiales bacterium]|nr:aldo/keto reductase [Clostridiales bacterium]
MRYQTFQENVKLSKLGLGVMRLPQTEPGFAKPVDEQKAHKLIAYCMEHGINYYDTAYIYHGGKSEVILGHALSQYPRDSYYVADKFNIQANPDYRFQFQEQLRRLQMEYIDFYLLHGVTDLTAPLYEECGCIPYFQKEKQLGNIKYLGFSFHGTPDCLRKLLEKNRWDFVQIQLNYYDWFQGSAKEQYEILREHDIPIMVMEPVHGGMLANLPAEGLQYLPDGDVSPAAWALRFVMQLPGVAVVLSGMSDMKQAEENVATASEASELSPEELAGLQQISDFLRRKIAVPCTACRYCCDDCPQSLDIPSLLAAYNDYRDDAAALGDKHLAAWRLSRLQAMSEDRQPAACIGCGSCTAHCPQSLDIPAYMKEMAAMLQQ